ncbi:tail fiber protein [Bacillus phage pW2]|uniref:Tail fiber protein n=1 Tax=Bacillus phage pW2 TaxID=2500559 RepID=A0A3T0IHM8_9CAUD|nr:tail fiber protein [Bacillus phage pW2]AZU98920.1 tail fiber protein [Bacillus phage pW2]
MPNIIGTGQLTLTDLNDVIASPTAPTNPVEGALWWNTIEKKLYVYSGGKWIFSGDGIIVGGTNLLRYTKDFVKGWGTFQAVTNLTVVNDERFGKALEATSDNSTTSRNPAIASDAVDVEEGKEYTFSMWIKRETAGVVAQLVKFIDASGNQSNPIPANDTQVPANTWYYFTHTFKVPIGTKKTYVTPRIITSEASKKFWVTHPKLEKGNIPTAYDPSPDDTYEVITDITETLGNMANDNLIDYNERQVVKEKVQEIIGITIADTANLPDDTTLMAGTKGLYYTVRKQAQEIGIATNHAKYTAVATTYSTLRTYLNNMNPKPWNVSTANQKDNITVVKGTYRDNWLNFYNALNDLSLYTIQVAKENVDNVEMGGTNYASNGSFEIPLDEGLWKDYYVGNVKEIVDISTEEPPFKFAYHVKNTTNIVGGIELPVLWSGKACEALVGREVTVQFWLKYQGVTQGASSWNLARFGELVIEGEKSDGTKVNRLVRFTSPTTTSESAYISGSDMTWRKYVSTTKLSLPTGTVKLTKVSFRHNLYGCAGEFWTTGIKVEFGNKASDWSQSPFDLEQRIYKTEFAVKPDQITSTVTSHQTFVTKLQETEDKAVNRVVVGGANMIDGTDFKEATGWTNWGGLGRVGVYDITTIGRSLYVETKDASNNQLDVPINTPVGIQGTASRSFNVLKDQEYTISMNVATSELGNTLDYTYILHTNSADNMKLPTIKVTDYPQIKPIYVGATIYYHYVTITFKAKMDDSVRILIGGRTTRELKPSAGVTGYAWVRVNQLQVEKGNKATSWGLSSNDVIQPIYDMFADDKLTPVEKKTLKNELDMIVAEKPTYVSKADQYMITTEKNDYIKAYDDLYSSLSPHLSNLNTTTSGVNGSAIRGFFKAYTDKRAVLEKAILQGIQYGGRNIIKNSTFNRVDVNGVIESWLNSTRFEKIDPEADKTTSSIISMTNTGSATDINAQMWSDAVTVNANGIQDFTISFDIKSTKIADIDSGKVLFVLRMFNDPSKTGQADSVWYKNITVTDLINAGMTDGKWIRYSFTVRPTVGIYLKVSPYMNRNGEARWREIKVELGQKATDWTPAPEDTDKFIYAIEERVSQAESKITDSAIINTVIQSTSYKNDLGAKANSEDLKGYATTGQLDQAKQDANKYADDKVSSIDLTPFVVKSEMTQTINDITTKFQAGGGVNLLRNSVGYADFSFWTQTSPTYMKTVGNNALDSLGFGKGFYFFPSAGASQIRQDVYVTAGQPYTLSWHMNKTNASPSTNNDGVMWVQILEGVTTVASYKYHSEFTTKGFEKNSYVYTPKSNVVTIRIYAEKLADATVSGLMFNIGDVPLQWSMATGEIYNTNIRMDMNGIKVSQIVNGEDRGFTQITPSEFAGYYDLDGDGVYEKVFYLQEDETVSKKFRAKDEFTMGGIKIIKIESTSNKGWAFVQNLD